MRTLVLIIAMFFAGCATTTYKFDGGSHHDFVPKFEVGDCVRFNPELVEKWERSDANKVPMKVQAIGKRHYVVSIKHPMFGPQKVTIPMINFNRLFVTTKCFDIGTPPPPLDLPKDKPRDRDFDL